MKKIVIVGATSSIAEHCARLWIRENPINLTLVSRNREKTENIAADLRIRSPQSVVNIVQTSFFDPNAVYIAVDEIMASGPIDVVLIAQGSLPDQITCQEDLTACNNALLINGVSPILFAEAFAGHMQKANKGTLAIIGSVAGDRGRKSNYIYGSAKGMIERYVQGLQHRLTKTKVKVTIIKPGPTDTPMTHHLKQQGAKLASVSIVAKNIVNGLDKGKSTIYTPIKWALIMMIIRHLPKFIFSKMEI